MNTAVNVNVVHESEAQRQHARVRIPAKLRFLDPQRQAHDVKVDDLSAGGLSFHTKQQLSVGDVLRGRLQFTVDNLGLSMDIEFQVRSYNPDNGRTGAQFQNLEPRDIATLRHIQHLSQNEGINLEGIRRILALENELDAVRAQLSRVADLLTALQHEVPAARIFTAAAAGDVHLGRSAARRPALALPSRASTARDLARRDVPPVSKAL